MKTRTMVLIALAAALTVACNKPKQKTEPADEKPEPVASAKAEEPEKKVEEAEVMTAGEPDTEIPADEVPTPVHLEEEATTKMAMANLELELDALEAEIED